MIGSLELELFDEYSKEALKKLYPGVLPDDRVIFLGFDPRETIAYQIAKFSIQQRSPGVKVFPLYTKDLRQAGIYDRPMRVDGQTGQFIDERENRPHSVDFSFTRFLVPYISRQLGIRNWSLFADCDFLFLEDLNVLFDQLQNQIDALKDFTKNLQEMPNVQ